MAPQQARTLPTAPPPRPGAALRRIKTEKSGKLCSEVSRLKIEVIDLEKLVCVWLTRAESADEHLRES
jgi:hypothetical protein